MFWLAVPLALAAAALMAGFLPRSAPEADLGYGRLLWSLGALWREFPALRLAAATQALLFGAFTAFWTILAFHLQEPRFGLGADVAGLFGIVGTVGIFAAPIAGRFADRRGPRAVIVAGALLTLLTFGAWRAMAGLIEGTILLDFATQSALVSNQTVVFALRPEAQARVNTIFIGTMFLGGAVGSAAATAAWRAAGWSGVTALGVALSALASALQAGTLIRRRHSS
jgi:predicted MFS family arabinose efflux permease